MWDLEKEENFVLALDANPGYDRLETLTCVAYNSNKGKT